MRMLHMFRGHKRNAFIVKAVLKYSGFQILALGCEIGSMIPISSLTGY